MRNNFNCKVSEKSKSSVCECLVCYHLPFSRAALGALASGVFLLAPVQADDSEIRYFDQPPSAEALADILFPTQYRSIKGDADVPEQPRFSGFGMPIQFEYGSTIIIAPSLPYLDSVGEMLNLDGVEDRKLIIEGHTDSAGSREYNQKLSESRAEAVKLYLMSVFNIDPDRLVTVGRGETELFDRRDPLAATNRRVEFHKSTAP